MLNEILVFLVVIVLGVVAYFGFIKPGAHPTPTPTPKMVSYTPTPHPSLDATVSPTDSPSNSTTIKGEGFSFELPNTWRVIRNDGVGIGLLSKELYDAGQTSVEIFTIGTRTSTESPRDWSINFNGLGYSQEKDIVINDNPAFYSVYEKAEYTDIKYVVSNGSRVVATNFRKISTNPTMDNSKYVDQMASIVNSIKYTE